MYLDGSEYFRKKEFLFVLFEGSRKGLESPWYAISAWIKACIRQIHRLNYQNWARSLEPDFPQD